MQAALHGVERGLEQAVRFMVPALLLLMVVLLGYLLVNLVMGNLVEPRVMGYSMGGKGTWAWINESADRFAAAAPCG